MLFRLRDIVLSTLALLVLSPLFLLLMLLLKVGQGQVFFVQQRPGKDEKLFPLVKFAKMDREGKQLTQIGRFLQISSLDELPQLLNVLAGDMSLIGPRPLLPEYLPLYTEEEKIRHQVKPGISGWAQVSGRNALSFKQRFQLDIWYVNNRSLWLDFKIMLLTLKKLFSRGENTFKMERYNGQN